MGRESDWHKTCVLPDPCFSLPDALWPFIHDSCLWSLPEDLQNPYLWGLAGPSSWAPIPGGWSGEWMAPTGCHSISFIGITGDCAARWGWSLILYDSHLMSDTRSIQDNRVNQLSPVLGLHLNQVCSTPQPPQAPGNEGGHVPGGWLGLSLPQAFDTIAQQCQLAFPVEVLSGLW